MPRGPPPHPKAQRSLVFYHEPRVCKSVAQARTTARRRERDKDEVEASQRRKRGRRVVEGKGISDGEHEASLRGAPRRNKGVWTAHKGHCTEFTLPFPEMAGRGGTCSLSFLVRSCSLPTPLSAVLLPPSPLHHHPPPFTQLPNARCSRSSKGTGSKELAAQASPRLASPRAQSPALPKKASRSNHPSPKGTQGLPRTGSRLILRASPHPGEPEPSPRGAKEHPCNPHPEPSAQATHKERRLVIPKMQNSSNSTNAIHEQEKTNDEDMIPALLSRVCFLLPRGPLGPHHTLPSNPQLYKPPVPIKSHGPKRPYKIRLCDATPCK